MKIKNYYHPTPKKWRKLGDAILATGTMITAGGLVTFDQLKDIFGDHFLKVVIGIAFFLGVAGKFLTNFFKEEPADQANCTDGSCTVKD